VYDLAIFSTDRSQPDSLLTDLKALQATSTPICLGIVTRGLEEAITTCN